MAKQTKLDIYRRAEVVERDGNVAIRIKLGIVNNNDWGRLCRCLRMFGEQYTLVDAEFLPEIVSIEHLTNLPWSVFEEQIKNEKAYGER